MIAAPKQLGPEAPESDSVTVAHGGTRASALANGLLYAKKLGIKEAAKMVGVGETKMRQFIKNGDIPAILIDGKYLLLERDLEAFLQGHYGRISVREKKPKHKPSLPKFVAESELLKRAG